MILSICFVVIPLLLYTIWWYYTYFKYKKCLKSFTSRSHLPLLGIGYHMRNTVDMYSTALSMAKEIKSKNYFTMVGPYPVLFTWDPKIFSIILGSSKHINRPDLYKTLENSLENSILLVNGDTWRQQRKLLNPALDYKNVMQNINVFNVQSDKLVELLMEEVNKESTKVDDLLESWALQQVYDTMFGGNVAVENNIEIQKAVKGLLKIACTRMIKINEFLNITYVFTKNFWRERKMLKVVFDHTWNIINMKKQEYAQEINQTEKPMLIDILMKQKEINKNITYDFITKQLNAMMVAGADTTSTSVIFILYHLSIYPEMQEKAYNEVYSILGNDVKQFITHEHVKQMKYLDLIIKESIRMKTIIPFFARQLDEDVNFEGSILPKGLTVVMLAYVMHLDPDVYSEPEKFIPERFLLENINTNRYSYVPFSGGIRNCIGKKYAMLAMKIVLAKILLNYKLVDVNHELCLSCEIVLKSKTGVKVGIRKRNVCN